MINLENFQTLNASQGLEGKISEKYSFIPTTRVLDQLESYGWLPSKVVEMNCRNKEYKGFQKHAVRLRHKDYDINDVGFPEIVLSNSHMGTSAFKLQLGLFRIVCSNGLIAGDIYKTASVRHMGFTEEAVHDALTAIVSDAPRLTTDVSTMRQISLTPDEQIAYGTAVIEACFESEKYDIQPQAILRGRRYSDGASQTDRDLFTTFNVVQENIIKGGYMMHEKETGHRRRARAIKGLDSSEKMNKAIWKLADTMKELRA